MTLLRIVPSHPLQRQSQFARGGQREPITALSGISRTSMLPFVTIQRFAPSQSPAISAEFMQNLHKLRNL